ncbi:MAG: glycosyltransferase [Lachnospiraceae bacterium]|nr:glycosyltransferase [Lachnospiraceae bacterium]
MRIVVINTAASVSGAMTVLKDFYNFVKENDKENEWIFLVSDKYIEDADNIKVVLCPQFKKNWIARLKFELLVGGKFVESFKPDLIFSMQNTLPKHIHTKSAMYVHNPMVFQNAKKFSPFRKEERVYAIYQYLIGNMILSSIRKTDVVIVQTKWMEKSVAKKAHIKTDKIRRIMPDVNDFSNYHANSDSLLQSDTNNKVIKFYFPAQDIIYKNHSAIIAAGMILRKKGIFNFEVTFTPAEVDVIKRLSKTMFYTLSVSDENKGLFEDENALDELFDNNIKCLGKFSHEKVMETFCESALIFPSYIETFGYPLIEARQVRTFELVSDTDFSHELLDDYKNAYFFNPFKPEELAALMEKVIKGELPLHSDDEEYSLRTVESNWKKVVQEITNVV